MLVWIYGGAYTSGSVALDLYRPHHFVRRGIVHVAMQYRLGVLGFLFMGRRTTAPGNVGLLDQVYHVQAKVILKEALNSVMIFQPWQQKLYLKLGNFDLTRQLRVLLEKWKH